ncbi:hypothetical protein CRG98_018312 [Punica granatum]|uniref:Uncharacterized protein n=1 Tax=Punica granatum TaxID=22663 RepID=A0A2I0K0P4_PUNGR|nr:hypothetical protein CRG98_018312 [Punica granatum]
MEKNKNRTDLLAAGRKKLQQFRQKKDGKGETSQGKSTKKPSKSEQLESNAVDAASKPQDIDVEAASQCVDPAVIPASSSVPPASDNSVVSEVPSVSSEIRTVAGPSSRDLDADKPISSAGQVEGESTSVGTVDGEFSSTEVPEVLDSEEKLPLISIPPSASSVAPASIDDTPGETAAADSMESTEDEESLLSHEYILVGSLKNAKGSQVGAMQEADTLGPAQFSGDGELDHGADRRAPVSELAVTSELQCFPKSTSGHVEEARYEMVQAEESSASAVLAHGCDEFSHPSSSVLEADGFSKISHECGDQEREDRTGIENSVFNECSSLNRKCDETDVNVRELKERCQDLGGQGYKGNSCEGHLESESATSTGLTVSQCADSGSISLSQLIDVVKRLGEDDYNLLLASRYFVSDGNAQRNGGAVVPECIHPSVIEQFEEELFLANITTDVLCWQLEENSKFQVGFHSCQQQFVNEISMLHNSVDAFSEKNESLTEELVLLKSELQAVISGRDDLQNQLHAKKLEAEELHERVHGLQTALEDLQQNFLSQSIELADCKSALAALQMENHKLSRDVASVTEEWNIQEEEKKNMSHVNEKLSIELAEYQNMVASFRGQLSILDDALSSATDRGNKLEEEKEGLVHENERLYTTSADSKRLLEVLQIEKDNFSESLGAVSRELEKTKEEREFFGRECERLSSELLLIKEQFSSEKEGRMRSEDELKEKIISLEKLAEENRSLGSTIDMYTAKISDLNNKQFQADSFAGDAVNQFQNFDEALINQVYGATFPVAESVLSQQTMWPPVELVGQQISAASSAFEALRGHSLELDKMLQKLEKAIEGMHSNSTYPNKSDEGTGPGISKLIQAFESKGHLSEQNQETESLMEDQSHVDPYMSSREQIRNLKMMAKQLGLDVEHATLLFSRELKHRRTTDVKVEQLGAQSEIFKEHADSIHALSIELGVLYEVIKQQLYDSEIKKTQLETVCEELKLQDIPLRAENNQLILKLKDYESKVSNLQNQLHDLQHTSGDIESFLVGQLETLQREAAESAVISQLRWTAVASEVFESVQKLEAYTSLISARTFHDVDLGRYVASSISAAIKVIEDLQEKLKCVDKDQKAFDDLYQEVNEKLLISQGKSDLAISRLHSIYDKLRELVLSSSGSMEQYAVQTEEKEVSDTLDDSNYDSLLERLRSILGERQQIGSEVIALQSKLSARMQDIQELEARCIDMDSIHRLITAVGGVLELEAAECNLSERPLRLLESLIHALFKKCAEANKHIGLSSDDMEYNRVQLTELQEKLNQSSSLNLQHEGEILILRESLTQAEEALVAARAELKEKAVELEQSEQRVSSIREKLSIAVAKGKGLVVQRDHLKQKLAETSGELEKCLKELELKEARVHEVEAKLVSYSEAGERVEALESELSYIRNSATALRESFLLKDSLLQRIEEILEDLDLPEHFHFKDIIEKVDWLARSVTGNALPPADLDQKSSVGGSYSDTGFAVMDAWREDMQPSLNPSDDLRRKYDELQGKFYGLAEQNEMLEQSLMERNNLVQRWEGLLDRINVPMHVRSVEPEEKIEWLANALSQAHHDRVSLEQKIDEIETYCNSLTSDLEDSHHRISNLQNEIDVLVRERVDLSQRLEMLTQNNEELSGKVHHFEVEKDNLLSERSQLHEELARKVEKKENAQRIEQEIRKLQDMVSEVLLDQVTEDFCSGGSNIEILAVLLKKLIEKYAAVSSDPLVSDGDVPVNRNADAAGPKLRTRETMDTEEQNQGIVVLKNKVEDALGELMQVKEQRDEFLEKNNSLIDLVGALERKRDDLQSLLDMEEQKCASVKEKLNVAVRKGKSLVQQRDVLKNTIEDLNTEVDRLKSEVNRREDALARYEQRIQELSSYPQRVGALESEISYLKNQLTEAERYWQDKEHMMGLILRTLADIDVGVQVDSSDPVEKLKQIKKMCSDLRVAAVSLEQESKKSRRAAELLLAELNEVQERNDGLQEQIAEAASEITRLSEEKDAAIFQLNDLSCYQSEEKRSIFSELTKLKSAVGLLRKVFSDFESSMTDVLSRDREILKMVETAIGSSLQQNEASDDGIRLTISSIFGALDLHKFHQENFPFAYPEADSKMLEQLDGNLLEDCSFVGNHLQDFFLGFGVLKESLKKHLAQLQEQATSLSEKLSVVCHEIVSRKESSEVTEKDIKHLISAHKEKDMAIVSLRRNMALLYEACSISLMEIENSNAALTGNSLSIEDRGVNRNATIFTSEGFSSNDHAHLSSEESVSSFADRMISAAKSLAYAKADIMEITLKELKNRVADLQKELQEKDIQKDRICMELVGQIKVAEATATGYSLDLQSTKALVLDLEKQVMAAEEQRSLLEEKVRRMQDGEVAAQELQERLRLLTKLLASKDQEIEALMQALDEEELQMDDLTKKIEELESVVQQKDLVVKDLEVSRGKALKKLSVTMSKFHELHHFSTSLLAEVEKLQIQMKEKDAEISFLRQEVTRCTNDVLAATQLSNNRDSGELFEFLTWFDSMISRVASYELDYEKTDQVQEYKELLQKRLASVVSELESLRVASENKDALLQAERSKIEELKRNELTLEKSLREKESQLNLLQGSEDSGRASGLTSEIVEIEPAINKRAVSVSTAPQVRSLRKPNNDQLAIAIDMDPGGSTRLEDEDDNKVHGFKSLATSRIVPKFTRGVTDMVDGLWFFGSTERWLNQF